MSAIRKGTLVLLPKRVANILPNDPNKHLSRLALVTRTLDLTEEKKQGLSLIFLKQFGRKEEIIEKESDLTYLITTNDAAQSSIEDVIKENLFRVIQALIRAIL